MARIKTEMSSRLPRGVTLKRDITGNYYDPNGVQQSAAIDVPRFDVHPVSLRSLGLLIEDNDDVAFDDPSLLNGEHVYAIEFHVPANLAAERYVFDVNDGSGDNAVHLYYGVDQIWHMHVWSAGVRVANNETGIIVDIVGWHKAALLVSPNDFAFYFDGVLVDTDNNGPVPRDFTIGCLGQNAAKSSRLNGTILRFQVGPALEHAALLALTSDVPPNEPLVSVGLIAHWDASALTAGAKSQINDQTANAYHLVQATGDNQPIVITNAQNSLSAARFDGANDWMAADALGAVLDGTDTPWTIFVVCRLNVLTGIGGDTWWSLGSSSNQNPRLRITMRDITQEDSVRLQLRDDIGATQNIDDGAAALDTNFHIYAFVYTGTNYTQWKDNVLIVDDVLADHGAMTYDQFTVGAYRRSAPQSWANFDLGELRIYDSALSQANIDAVEATLNTKWAVY